jgi:hypothetical protein
MTSVGTPRGSEWASMTPAVYIGSAAHNYPRCPISNAKAILAQFAKVSILLHGQPARGRRIGSDCGPTGLTRPSNRGGIPNPAVLRWKSMQVHERHLE